MATLYEWTGAGFEAQAHLQEVLDDPDSTEEERTAALKEFQAIQMAIEKKLESYLKILKNRAADSDVLDTEIKRLQTRKKSADADIERIREQILAAMQAAKKKKVQTTIGTFSMKTIQKLVTHFGEDGALDEIPKEFLEEQPPKVDKKGLKKYLSDHPDVYMDAAELVDAPSLMIR